MCINAVGAISDYHRGATIASGLSISFYFGLIVQLYRFRPGGWPLGGYQNNLYTPHEIISYRMHSHEIHCRRIAGDYIGMGSNIYKIYGILIIEQPFFFCGGLSPNKIKNLKLEEFHWLTGLMWIYVPNCHYIPMNWGIIIKKLMYSSDDTLIEWNISKLAVSFF